MKTNIVKFEYQDKPIEFEIENTEIMVNATAMAKIYGKEPFEFYRWDKVQDF